MRRILAPESGLQPLTSILSRNKTTGQMQLTAPPQVIDSGLPHRGGGEMYKKPQIIAPPSSSTSQQQQQQHNRSVPNPMYQQRKLVTSSRLPISHQQSPGSTYSSEHASAGEMARVQVLTIPTRLIASCGFYTLVKERWAKAVLCVGYKNNQTCSMFVDYIPLLAKAKHSS